MRLTKLIRFRTNAGDVANNFLHCGDYVRDKNDPRHVGELLAITRGTGKVRWIETNWISEVFVHDLEKTEL
jgi:hypothetical protein